MLKDAYENHYAVGAFNVYNYETMKGVIDSAAECNCPVIVAFGEKYLHNMSLRDVAYLAKSFSEQYSIPFCLHLDHCSSLQVVFQAIREGFSSVMYDGSRLPFEENVANTKLVCRVAHACGVSVEAELGSIASGERSYEGSTEDKEIYTSPDKAKEFVDETGCDALAVSIGTVHGFYKGEPNIRIDILKEINSKLNVPLVLHGGSGIPERTIRECIGNGVAKINVNTEISAFALDKTKRLLNTKDDLHLSGVALEISNAVSEVVKKYINFFRNK